MIVPILFTPPDIEVQPTWQSWSEDSEPNSRLVRRLVWPFSTTFELDVRVEPPGGASRVRSWPVRKFFATPRFASPAAELEAEIKRAEKTILSLQSDWDGEGSCTYSAATLNRATSLLRLYQEQMRRSSGSSIPPPSIGAGPDGSIDLYWENTCGKLLVNIPADLAELAAYAGTDSFGQKAKGSFDPSRFNHGIAGWLTNLLGQ